MADDILHDVRARAPVERLLEDSWSDRSRRASRRELRSEGAGAAAFLAVTVPLAVTSLHGRSVSAWLCTLLVVVFAVVSRTVRLPVGAGYVIPSYLVLVPMLLLLPPLLVPLLVGVSLSLGSLGRWLLGHAGPEDMLIAVPDGWYAVGPALVLAATGDVHGVRLAAAYVGAFLAGCLVDLVASTLREWLVSGIAPQVQTRVILRAWMLDACFAPLGLGIGVAASHDLLGLLLLVPLGGLMAFVNRDRVVRIAQAQERLEVLAHERARLQSAVHRLGDAFAAKLDLGALGDVLLRSTVEALDAAGGRLELGDLVLEHRHDGLAELLVAAVGRARAVGGPAEPHGEAGWAFAVALHAPDDTFGALAVARADRAFTADEQRLMAGLAARAEVAAAEIVAHERLQEQVLTDPLTRLGNRRGLAGALEANLRVASPADPWMLAIFDLDGFKAYNDTYGHPAGDALLARLGLRLRAAVAPGGSAYRLGGDEFCALLPAGDDVEQRLGDARAALTEREDTLVVSASCGAVLLPLEAHTAQTALALADQRMYAHKHARRSRGIAGAPAAG